MEKFNIVKRITKPTEINTYTFILFQQFLNIAYSQKTPLRLRSESDTDHLERQKQ